MSGVLLRPEFSASAQLAAVTAGPRKDGPITATRSALGVPAGEVAWGITVPHQARSRHTSFPRRHTMARQATTMRLRPAKAEGWTQLSISCAVPDSLPPPALYQLLSLLAFWSGRQLIVALAADGPASWCEAWSDALATAPERHVRLRFDLGGEDGSRDG